jgi:myo-inositol-1(or 4)-monophosphatase
MLACAVSAARAAGQVMRANLLAVKKINESTQHDIKLALDVRCQKIIERILGRGFPDVAILGEEGVVGDSAAARRWVVDPIDGTVNFTYGIPHACVSIALQATQPSKVQGLKSKGRAAAEFQTIAGVIYDPFCDELWTALRGGPARLNGRVVRASAKTRLDEAIVSIGFAKEEDTLARMLPTLNQLVHRVRKIRIMGSAALSLAYVASGRMDAYIEYGLRLWDIAAGGLIVESAGGRFWNEPVLDGTRYRILASNGRLHRQLRACA